MPCVCPLDALFCVQACVFTFFDAFDESHFHDVYARWPRAGPGIITVYLVMVMLVMVNLLLARMGDTYNRISEYAELEWLLQRARIVRGIENEMTDTERNELSERFFMQDRSGRLCFQVAEVDPEYWKRSRHEAPGANKRSAARRSSA